MGKLMYLHFSVNYNGKWHDLINQTVKYVILCALYLCISEETFRQRLPVALLISLFQALVTGLEV